MIPTPLRTPGPFRFIRPLPSPLRTPIRPPVSLRLQEFGNIYTRIMNPTTDVLEKRVASLENGAAGLALVERPGGTVSDAFDYCRARATTSFPRARYTVELSRQFDVTMRRMGYDFKFVEPDDPENFRKAITPKTKAAVWRDHQQSAQ